MAGGLTVPMTTEMNVIFEDLVSILDKEQCKSGYSFDGEEALKILSHTVRKCGLTGNEADYIPILFENELHDYIMRLAVNHIGRKEHAQ